MTESNRRLAPALLVAGLVVTMTSAPGAAFADGPAPSPPTEELVQAARVPYREARELQRQGKSREALERALEAYRIAATPVTALEAGQLLVDAGRLVEARDVVRSVALFPVSPRESEKGRESRQEAAALGATLDARIPKVAIAGRPAGVDVLFDGKPLVASDPTAWLGVDPGVHALVVRAAERTCTTINVTLAEAEARTIDLHDAAATCRPPEPVAETNQPLPAPPPPLQPPPPARASSVSAAPPPAPSEATSTPWKWVGVAIAGAGAIGIGVAGGIALDAKSKYDGVASECPPAGCSLAGFDARENARSQADVATAVMVVGAAALAGGALLFILAPSSGSSEAGHPVVGIGPGSVRLSVSFQ
jgi:hypothetical protein